MNTPFEQKPTIRITPGGALRRATPTIALACAMLLGAGGLAAQAVAPSDAAVPSGPLWEWDASDPRIGLEPGLHDGGEAIGNLEHLANLPRPEGFSTNSDFAFRGDVAFMGNYNGFNVYDISEPAAPELRLSVVCPGNQGDLSVYGDLLFMSVQARGGRLDCGSEGVEDSISVDRMRGVRIFDISDVDSPQQIAAVQTCRGSHTHTLASSPEDPDNVYIYVSGTSSPRPEDELDGCSDRDPDVDPETSLFQIEVIQVPLDDPASARVVSEPRIFADPETGAVAGLWPGGDHGAGTQRTSRTAACHDITTYPDLGLAGGACSGNGIVLDISDPANPVRVDDVVDPGFAYWHSATFNNDGTKILFTDEWGGGGRPRCQATDPSTWGADALFELSEGELRHRGYYKLPVPQTEFENCVAHNGSLIPVPGRDLFVQAWYQGGISIVDFTDADAPFEVAYFDRGPISVDGGSGGGFWSAYWYNGHIYASEMARGLDVFALVPSEHLSANEIEAARSVQLEQFNAQHQPRFVWPVSESVARSYLDQLIRDENLDSDFADRIDSGLAEEDGDSLLTSAEALEAEAISGLLDGRNGNAERVKALLAAVLRDLAPTME